MLRSLLRHYRSERRSLLILASVGLLTAVAEAASLVALAPLLQAVAEGRESYTGDVGPLQLDLSIAQLSATAAGLLVVTLILTALSAYISARIVSDFQVRRRLELTDAFLSADWEAQTSARGGRLVAFSLEFVNQSATGLRDLAGLARYGAGLFVFVGGALIVSWTVTVALTLVAAAIYFVQRPIRSRARRYADEYLKAQVHVSEELSTIEDAAREFDAYGVGPSASMRLRELTEQQRSLRIRRDLLSALPAPMFRTSGLLMIVALIGSAAATGSIEIAALGVVVLLLYRSLTYGQSLATVHAKLVVLEPLLDQLAEEHDRLEAASRPLVDGIAGDASSLRLEDACYAYPSADSAALEHVSIEVRRGEIVGLVGPSGAGKSTMADLLVGLRTPTSGRALIDDHPLSGVSEADRSHLISLVPQAVTVVPGTVAENVAFHRPIPKEAVEAALTDVGLRRFIEELPGGCDTPIGPGNRTVSGGQAQRLGVARALAGDPAFIVLDEPTSALDAGSEEIITDLIGRLRGNVGLIVIAHRLTTLRHCDRVIVVEHGRISGDAALTELRQTNAYVRSALELGSLDWVDEEVPQG